MGKRYYCDYCDKTMSCAPSIIKTHNNGLLHQRAKQEHYQKFKNAETILAEESKKKPCVRFPRGECQYGSVCRFSHYSPEAIQYLQNYVSSQRLAESVSKQPCFQDLYNQLQNEKKTEISEDHTILIDENGITHKLPWGYNQVFDGFGDSLPPSLKRITLEDFKNANICEWG